MNETWMRDWLTKEEAELFIGKNSSFYLDQWHRYADSTLKGWNWSAMYFNIEWMAYRKMYVEACLYLLVQTLFLVCSVVVFELLEIRGDSTYLSTLLRISIGIFGNTLYRKKALRVLNRTKDMDEPARNRFLQMKGGVSVVSVFVCIAIEIVIAYIIISLF